MIFKNLITETYLYIKSIFSNIFPKGKYFMKIQSWKNKNKLRKNPRMYTVFRLEGEDATKNAIFSSFKLGIKLHMIFRGYIGKIASLLPPCSLQQCLFRLAGLIIEKDVFIAQELTIDVVVNGWTRFRKGSSYGIGVKCFNHLFEQNGRIILGYIDIGEKTSLGGFVTLTPGVKIGKNADIGAEVKIGPGVTIGDNVKIGAGVMIAPFIRIGEGAVITTCSVVLQNVSPFTKVQGNPAKPVPWKVKSRKPKMDLIVNHSLNIEELAKLKAIQK